MTQKESRIEVEVRLTEDDVEDLLNAIQVYEDELMYGEDQSGYVVDVLNNLEILREKLTAGVREALH